MQSITLSAKKRQGGRVALKEIRRRGAIPAVVYGGGIENLHIEIDRNTFGKIYSDLSESTLIDLALAGGETLKVLVPQVQRHPVTDQFLHVDFRNIRMDEELEVTIDLSLVGEPPAVKAHLGILEQNTESIYVKCLPSALVDEIEVDVSALRTLEDKIRIKDLNIPAGMRVLEDAEQIVASISEVEEEVLTEAVPVPDVAGVAKVGDTGAATAEGSTGDTVATSDKSPKSGADAGKKG